MEWGLTRFNIMQKLVISEVPWTSFKENELLNILEGTVRTMFQL